jgi:zinc/manganese transport system permease protein
MFDLLSFDVFQKALLGGTVAAVMAGVVGYFLVLRAQAFAAESFMDICFAGATGASLLGQSPLVGMIAFSVLSALSLGALGERARGRSVEIRMVLSLALGLGVLFLSVYTRSSASHSNAGVSILFGSILSVQVADICRMLACGSVALLALAAVYRPLLFASIDPSSARARGVPVRALSIVFLLVLALAAAAAMKLTTRPSRSLLLSAAIGLFVTWAGLLVSFAGPRHHPPVSFSVSALAGVVYGAPAIRGWRGRSRPVQPSDLDRQVR